MEYLILLSIFVLSLSGHISSKPVFPECTQCPPGTETQRPCNTTHPSVCVPCKSGYFSNYIYGASLSSSLTCVACTTCGTKEYEYEPCAVDTDTICKPCWLISHTNIDFLEKCAEYYQTHIKSHTLYKKPKPKCKDCEGMLGDAAKNLEEEYLIPSKGDDLLKKQDFDGNDDDDDDGSGEEFNDNADPKHTEEDNEEEMVEDVEEGSGAVDVDPEITSDAMILSTAIPSTTKEEDSDESEEDDDGLAIAGIGENKEDSSDDVPLTGIIIAAVTAGIVCFLVGFFLNNLMCRRKEEKDGYVEAPTLDGNNYGNNHTEMRLLNQIEDIAYIDEPRDVLSVPILEQDEPAGSTNTLVPAQGRYQSPIDIRTDDADIDGMLQKNHLCFEYDPSKVRTITNTGSTVKIDSEGSGSVLSGGPLSDRTYLLDHFHFHWGSSDEIGSEHTINGKQYTAEIHLVHWNCEDYATFSEASRAEDGLAVVAVLIELGEEHAAMKKITDCMASIGYKGESRELPGEQFDPKDLMPDDKNSYWTYTGSLTTPPYYETVTWIIFKDPIEISPEQIQEFRKLVTYERDESHVMNRRSTAFLRDNFRKTLPLEGRVIKASFV